MRITALVATATLAVALTACGQSEDDPMDGAMTGSTPSMSDDMTKDDAMGDDMAGDMKGARKGSFEGVSGKTVTGAVAIADGKVQLTGFSSDQAPDLHLYLANGSDHAAVMAGRSLGEVNPADATQSFALDGVDPADYDTVVIHCDKAKAVYGAAKLS